MESCSFSSDSDSDAGMPVVKRQRATQSASQLMSQAKLSGAALGEATNKDIHFDSGLYSQCFNHTLEAAREGKLKDQLNTVAEDESDDDGSNSDFEMSPPQKGPKPIRNLFQTSTSRQRDKKFQESRRKRLEEYHPTVCLDDEELSQSQRSHESSITVLDGDISLTKEPTPPPTPVEKPVRKRTRKRKAINSALVNLEQETKKLHDVIDLDNDDDLCILDVTSPSSSQSDSEPFMVKVNTRTGIQRFPMQMTQSFGDIYDSMAKHEFVAEEQVSMFFRDQKVQRYDTPARLGLTVADILECYVGKPGENAEEADEANESDADTISLQVQGKNLKSRILIRIKMDDPMEKLMRLYSHKQRVPYKQLRFQFDGETIHPQETARDLELESDFCVDVLGL